MLNLKTDIQIRFQNETFYLNCYRHFNDKFAQSICFKTSGYKCYRCFCFGNLDFKEEDLLKLGVNSISINIRTIILKNEENL